MYLSPVFIRYVSPIIQFVTVSVYNVSLCFRYIAPFLLATTIVANTLIVVVLSRRHMRTPTNIVLMAMALCDMFTMLFPAPWLFYMYTFGNHYKPLSPVRACQAWNYMNEVSDFY
jgi:neuromedin U receptor 1